MNITLRRRAEINVEQELFQRARSPERKQLRRMAILQAASDVLARDGIEATSLNAIARQAGMVKSNIYRYFESREEILLRLMLLDLSDLNGDLEKKSRAEGPKMSWRPCSRADLRSGRGFASSSAGWR